MIVLLDGRNISHYALESLRVEQSIDGTVFNVVSDKLPELDSELLSFATKEEGLEFILRAQNAIVELDQFEYLDLRTPLTTPTQPEDNESE